MSAQKEMLEAARSACVAALKAVNAAITAGDESPEPIPQDEDFSSLTFEDTPAPPIRRKNGRQR